MKTPFEYRSRASRAAAERVLALCDQGKVVLSLGGGPLRLHPKLTTLNIERFENVDIVGDAHGLPLASDSIDAVHCEAVYEHLDDAPKAAAEMFRVMKPGAVGFVCTPFMQPFHGYPSHHQNFTVIGHAGLFERAGFEVVEKGTATGPAWAVAGVVATFLATYPPRILRLPLRAMWRVFSDIALRPLDRRLAEREDAYILASTVYAMVRKPEKAVARPTGIEPVFPA